MTCIANHNLWGRGGHSVVTLAPSRDDLFCVTTVAGHAARLQPIDQYDDAMRLAHEFVARLQHRRPVVVKVICLTLTEARDMGLLHDDQLSPEPTERLPETRQHVIATLSGVLRDGADPQARTDAYALLQQMGVIQ